MNFRRCPPARRNGLALLAAALLLVLMPSIHAAETCGDNSPAYPTPQFVGAVEVWPDHFRPAKPGQPLPATRDSTQYLSTTPANWRWGHEQFLAVAAVDPFVFVAYNVGLQAWDAEGSRAADPVLVSFKDGHEGHWIFHPPHGEMDGELKDMDAIQDPNDSDKIIVAVAATSVVGVSIWTFSRTTRQLTPVYQITTHESHDVELVAHGNKVYALYASITGTFVIDASSASLLGGCLDGECPSSILRGRVGSAPGSRYVGAAVKNGTLYVMSTYGGVPVSVPQGELWGVADPMHPSSAVRLYTTAVRDTHAPTIFKKGSLYYVAVIERLDFKIYPFDNCMDADGCTSLPATAFVDDTLWPVGWGRHLLTFSESVGDPFIYYGCTDCFGTSGNAIERLFDLSNLGTSSPVTEITASGGTYSDNLLPGSPCETAHTGIGYWSHQYSGNRYGLRNLGPHRGVFNGLYFYRTTTATFDVHVRDAVATHPQTQTAATSPAPHWLGEPVAFAATASNCPGPELWNFATEPYNHGVTGTGANDATASLTWNLCPTDDCPAVVTEVWATKDACAGASNLEVNGAAVTLEDPRPRIRDVEVTPVAPNDTYPLCSVLTFQADIDGKQPFTYLWTARNRNGVPLATGVGSTFVWDTQGVPILVPEVFTDGFETGDISRWNVSVPLTAASSVVPSPAESVAEGGGEAPFFVELLVTNPNLQSDSEIKQVILTEAGPLSFGSPQITVTNQGDGQYRFVANSQNATHWRWEFEDPAFGTVGGCRILAAARCSVIESGDDDNDVVYRWNAPNANGPYGVAVRIDNCEEAPLDSDAGFEVNVTGITSGNPPTVSQFKVDPAAWEPGNICDPDSPIASSYFCRINQAIPFQVTSADATHLQFDWNRDGVYEEEVAISAAVTHQWPTLGPLATKPQVRARKGSLLSAPRDLVKNMTLLP